MSPALLMLLNQLIQFSFG